MQIIYTQAELSEIVQKYVQETLNLSDDNSFVVDTHEEGVTIHINEEPEGSGATTSGEKPVKKPRRTKAQIEADNKAEADRLAALEGKSNEPATVTTTAASAPAEEPATPEAAGETTPEASASPGTTQPEAQAETPVDPQPEVATTVVVEEAETQAAAEPMKEAEPDPVAEEPAATETPKPTQSLFANLRRPKN